MTDRAGIVDADVLIVGGGAIGGVIAGLMTGHVGRVAVIDSNHEHVERMREGLSLDVLGEERRVPIEAHASAADVKGTFDLALVTVKAAHLDAALAPVRERDLAETYVVLGNGLVQDQVASIVGADRLIAGVVELGATNLGPGRVRQTTRNPFVIGEIDGRPSRRTQLAADVLGTVDEVRITDNISGQIWSKLLVNSTFSGLGVVGGCEYGDVAAHPLGRRAIAEVWREGHRVGIAQGLRMEVVLGIAPEQLAGGGEQAGEAIDVVIGHAGATRASMLQDVERGLATEVDVINGAVVARGAADGIPTPLNERIVALVHRFERGEETPSVELFDTVLGGAARSGVGAS